MDQVMNVAISSHPIAISGVEKVPSGLSSIIATAKPSRPLKYRSYQRLWLSSTTVHRCWLTSYVSERDNNQGNFTRWEGRTSATSLQEEGILSCSGFPSNLRNNGMVLLRNQHCLIHALPLQAVTTDNDSEGSTSPGPSPSSSVEYAGIFQADQGAKQSLLYYIRVWYTTAKTQKVSVSIQQALERSKTELQTVDKSQILQQIKSSKVTTFGIRWWESSQPWIKWPISIFVPWFLLVSVFYGTSASMDLLPLWIIGPLFVGLAIKASIQLSQSYRQWVADKKLIEGLAFVAKGLKTGQLPRQLVEVAGSRFEEAKLHGTKKKEELELLFQSGEYKVVLREFADKKLLELREACVDKYEDWRLVYLVLERKVKNII